MQKRVLTGFLAAAVAGTVLLPATAALANPGAHTTDGRIAGAGSASFEVRPAAQRDRPVVRNATASPSEVRAPRRGSARVEIRAEIRSGADLDRVVLDGPDFPRTTMTKLNRSVGPDGVYSGYVRVPAGARTGEWRFSVEAVDVNGRADGVDGRFQVEGDSEPAVASVKADRTATVTRDGATVAVEAVVKGGPAKVRVHQGGSAFTMYRAWGDTYRGELKLKRSVKAGKLTFEVRAYDRHGDVTHGRKGSVTVRKNATMGGFNASPEPVRRGREITVKGTLKGLTPGGGSYAGIAGARVEILFKNRGSNTYLRIKTVRTSGGGVFKLYLPAMGSGTWKAAFAGTGTHVAKSTRGDYVRVR